MNMSKVLYDKADRIMGIPFTHSGTQAPIHKSKATYDVTIVATEMCFKNFDKRFCKKNSRKFREPWD